VLVGSTHLLTLGDLRGEGGDGTSSTESGRCLKPVREQRGFAQQEEEVEHAPLRSGAWPWAGPLSSSSAGFTDAIKLLEKLWNRCKVVVVWFGY